ncbi:bifunctional NAD(P)/FAD-dependent oxidoreductase/class I SAM-dependent methyltransferase [Catenuloplanes indicus]|uniref:Thioredoxin reductase/2-polyprenyl-3-methyl-5-hydroxy-6-metoxy-1, 4-benzoquinol methylase n=1 Tax=Catenuloplanes indicus TaxID=137267 RepID=A0AAE3W7B7_9ACTN|nr:bifunctional NAD(P)/FAD-dependent oxidoreductase/class I SAM-dependent methyltransferase [Catenuloplanes indicus]MDQ0370670.1 thioredoxin reductase/2-polyprenyl-3-methyl-5-hydroxy-6-metoxy-1,4-benzoquinol methylase [Catenuloplanes indicus]
MREQYDVVVIGGGAAGLSGALALTRARRSVLVIDAGEPRNAPAGHVHNYLGRENTPPAELLRIGRAEVTSYGGEFLDATVTDVTGDADHGFVVTTPGARVRARRVLVTTGLVDELPDIPGLAERFGRDVLHCPYCHGYEVRDRAIGIIATGPMAVHGALLWGQWTGDVALFLHDGFTVTDEQREQLDARRVRIVEGRVTAVEVTGDRLTGVRLESGEIVPRDVLVVQTGVRPRDGLLTGLGIVAEEKRMGPVPIGAFVPVAPNGATSRPGVFAAGNVVDPMAQVIVAAGSGLVAGAALNMDLIEQDTRRAVAFRRLGVSGDDPAELHSRDYWERRYSAHGHRFSGNPNPHLVSDVAGLTPGRALDAGCGEGGDAIWLAKQGWRTTGVDISATALTRAAEHAAEAGVTVAWEQGDLAGWIPEPGAYDLVSTHFVHMYGAAAEDLYRRLGSGVAPGGTLLVVNHSYTDVAQAPLNRPDLPEMFMTAAQIAATLKPDEWDVQVAEERSRAARGTTVHDVVVRAKRR